MIYRTHADSSGPHRKDRALIYVNPPVPTDNLQDDYFKKVKIKRIKFLENPVFYSEKPLKEDQNLISVNITKRPVFSIHKENLQKAEWTDLKPWGRALKIRLNPKAATDIRIFTETFKGKTFAVRQGDIIIAVWKIKEEIKNGEIILDHGISEGEALKAIEYMEEEKK